MKMAKALENFLFGLTFGMGFMLALGVCKIVAALFGQAGMPMLK